MCYGHRQFVDDVKWCLSYLKVTRFAISPLFFFPLSLSLSLLLFYHILISLLLSNSLSRSISPFYSYTPPFSCPLTSSLSPSFSFSIHTDCQALATAQCIYAYQLKVSVSISRDVTPHHVTSQCVVWFSQQTSIPTLPFLITSPTSSNHPLLLALPFSLILCLILSSSSSIFSLHSSPTLCLFSPFSNPPPFPHSLPHPSSPL